MVTSRQRQPYRAGILPASLAALGVLFIVMSACAPVYLPNAIHTGVMEGAGEAHLAGYYGTGIGSLNAAASITDHIMLTGAYSFDPIEDSLNGKLYHIGHRFWEAGAGWYGGYTETKGAVILGFGRGHTAATSRDSLQGPTPSGAGFYRIEGDFNRVSLQVTGATPLRRRVRAAIPPGGSTSPYITESGFTLRLSYLWFDALDRSPLPQLHPRALFFEPVFFMRHGWYGFQGEFQIGASASRAYGGDFQTQGLFFNIGVHAILEHLW